MTTFFVQTAHGVKPFDDSDGYVLPHEHLIVDIRPWWTGPGDPYALDPPDVNFPDMTESMWREPEGTSRENMVLCDWYIAAKELQLAQVSGCKLLVDLTVQGLEPDQHLAVKAADSAGIDIVLSVGRYIGDSLSPDERRVSVEALSERWIAQCAEGHDGMLPGIVGEIGTSAILQESEILSLRAAARTHSATGFALNIHLHPYGKQGMDVLGILAAEGADPSKTVLSHCDGEVDLPLLRQLLRTGCYVEFDQFGTTADQVYEGRKYPDDVDRIDMLCALIDEGYSSNLLISQDVCHRNQLVRFGGPGYAHVWKSIGSQLEARYGPDVVRKLTMTNPLRLLAVRRNHERA